MSIKRTIKAGEIVADLLSGMKDSDLMAKHGVTGQELDSLLGYLVDSGLIAKSLLSVSDSQIARAFVDAREEVKEPNRKRSELFNSKLSPEVTWEDSRQQKKRVIQSAEVVRDIRLKMTDLEIMEKYRLSHRGLESLLKKLIAAGLISPEEMHWRPTEYEDTMVLDCDHFDFP
jgi:hypothetical protein